MVTPPAVRVNSRVKRAAPDAGATTGGLVPEPDTPEAPPVAPPEAGTPERAPELLGAGAAVEGAAPAAGLAELAASLPPEAVAV
jgi:hypothetical protein